MAVLMGVCQFHIQIGSQASFFLYRHLRMEKRYILQTIVIMWPAHACEVCLYAYMKCKRSLKTTQVCASKAINSKCLKVNVSRCCSRSMVKLVCSISQCHHPSIVARLRLRRYSCDKYNPLSLLRRCGCRDGGIWDWGGVLEWWYVVEKNPGCTAAFLWVSVSLKRLFYSRYITSDL